MPVLLILLIALPVLEIATFIEVGGAIGVWPTIGLVILAFFVGSALIRARGQATLARVEASLARHESPMPEVLNGMAVMLAGVLFVIPGFVTDAIALVLLVPALRALLARALWGTLARSGRVTTWAEHHAGGVVIEGEFREMGGKPDEASGKAGGDSPWRRLDDDGPRGTGGR